MNIARCLVLTALLAFPAAGEENTGARGAIRAARERLSAAEGRGDASAVLDSYAEDVILLPPGEETISSRSAALRWLESAAGKTGHPLRGGFETLSLEIDGNSASEIGEQILPGGSIRHLTIWRRQADGSWKISRDMWDRLAPSGGQPAPATASAAAPPAPVPPPDAPAPERKAAETLRESVQANREQFVPIPDPRSLSDGFTREVQDKIRSRSRKIRSLESSPPSADRDARLASTEREAAGYLEKTIRDIGWIDVHRFPVASSCDAAFLVEKSGDRRLMESTLPIMEKDLKNSEGSACYAAALKAYEGLGPKN